MTVTEALRRADRLVRDDGRRVYIPIGSRDAVLSEHLLTASALGKLADEVRRLRRLLRAKRSRAAAIRRS